MRRQSFVLSVEQSTVVNPRAPMFVLSVKDLVELDGLRTHEELQAMGKLVEWEDGMGDVMFVSQTWLRKEHPDDEQGSKFELLKVAAPGSQRGLVAWPCAALPRCGRMRPLHAHRALVPWPIYARPAPAAGVLLD